MPLFFNHYYLSHYHWHNSVSFGAITYRIVQVRGDGCFSFDCPFKIKCTVDDLDLPVLALVHEECLVEVGLFRVSMNYTVQN